MSIRIHDLDYEDPDIPAKPPFDMDQTYLVFGEEAMPCPGWGKASQLEKRAKEMKLPKELLPNVALGLQKGMMVLVWEIPENPGKLGFAIHNK